MAGVGHRRTGLSGSGAVRGTPPPVVTGGGVRRAARVGARTARTGPGGGPVVLAGLDAYLADGYRLLTATGS